MSLGAFIPEAFASERQFETFQVGFAIAEHCPAQEGLYDITGVKSLGADVPCLFLLAGTQKIVKWFNDEGVDLGQVVL